MNRLTVVAASLAAAATVIGCAEEPPEGAQVDVAASRADLPDCNQDSPQDLVYVLDQELLVVCFQGTWRDVEPRGEQGARGPQGVQGPEGEMGTRGTQGLQGDQGEQGGRGPKGEDGDRGEKGDLGQPGAPVLLNLVNQEPSLTCGLGGILVQSGSDVSQNGILDSWEVSSSALACTPRTKSRRVFVSSKGYQGKLVGPSGADALCQELANAVPELKDGTFRAWVSTYYATPTTRFVRDAALGFARVDGVRVANNWAELTSGSWLLAPISVDENGQTVPTGEVWTGTDWYGNAFGYGDCNYWETAEAGYYGSVGNALSTNEWTVSTASGYYAQLACNSAARIYCFEQ